MSKTQLSPILNIALFDNLDDLDLATTTKMFYFEMIFC